MADDFYLDEPCVVSFHIGELGWLLQRGVSRLRYLKFHKYQDRKFIIFMNPAFHVFVQDFIYVTIDLPEWFYELNLEKDCYESPLPDSPPGSLTPPDVYARLIEYFRQFYNKDKAIELWPPRGCNPIIDKRVQIFTRYTSDTLEQTDKPIISVFPRHRKRASNRNVPSFVWKELVDKLVEDFIVVLGGTPDGACLTDYDHPNVINLIRYDGSDKMERIIHYLNNSVCSISSQSGLTHVSLLSGCPTYIIGHEKRRHAEDENRLGVPVSFRYVYDYRAIDADTILHDVANFLDVLNKQGLLGAHFPQVSPPNNSDTDHQKIIDDGISRLKELM